MELHSSLELLTEAVPMFYYDSVGGCMPYLCSDWRKISICQIVICKVDICLGWTLIQLKDEVFQARENVAIQALEDVNEEEGERKEEG